ncbi:MAG: DUF1761 domain-containing protein [Actinobacteria bacterium]|nr:DUF1761 domain-containing protein [Actinomycetota bacterium]
MGFGHLWLKLMGVTEDQARALGNPTVGHAATTVGALALAYVLALLARFAGAQTFWEGLVLGLWIWVGVVITTSVDSYVFGGRGLRLWRSTTRTTWGRCR